MRYVMTLALLLMGLYITAAGYVAAKILQMDSVKTSTTAQPVEYHGNTFADVPSLLNFIDQQKARHTFGWVFFLPDVLILLVASLGAGYLGGAVRVPMLLRENSSLSYWQVLFEPVVGAGIGCVMFFLSFTLPIALFAGSNPVRPEALIAFSLCGGIFSERAYKFFEAQAAHLFTRAASSPRGSRG